MGPRIRVLPFPLLLSPYATDQPRPRLRAIVRDGCYFRTRNVSSCFDRTTPMFVRVDQRSITICRAARNSRRFFFVSEKAACYFRRQISPIGCRFCRLRDYRANFDLLWYLARPGDLVDYARNAVGSDLKNVSRKSIFENHVKLVRRLATKFA